MTFKVTEQVVPDYKFSDFIQELQNLYMVRLGMSISESSRYIVDTIEDIELAVANDISAIEYFQADLDAGVEV
ncbi:MAG: hypothetical protein [Myoviridae sp. ctThM1]|nr:MAG: hypothetical protein [Myoviridae sp. ctThM1]